MVMATAPIITDLPQTDRAVVAARAVVNDLSIRWSVSSAQVVKNHYDSTVRFYFRYYAPDQTHRECCHIVNTEQVYYENSLNLLVQIMIEGIEHLFAETDVVIFTDDYYREDYNDKNYLGSPLNF